MTKFPFTAIIKPGDGRKILIEVRQDGRRYRTRRLKTYEAKK